MSKKTVVLGASLKPERYSYKAVKALSNNNHEVIAIGLRKGEVNAVPIVTEEVIEKDIDTVSLYLNPARQEQYYDYILQLKPKRVIFNPGTENPELYKLLDKNQIEKEIACTLVLLRTNQY
ncbi:CoA-binding protein [Aquimarina sp. ERC-38]|uniref:CoA-binding protein n=1 Tax=Aquimarina sp. ERC-38 TaxID=2949996 RepID=UPI002245BB15|nr:CoA-binding protein [Aquimarina sp. ERC-38]UZO79426.1 CoA-binding protein [Aquimarina sp. ERC-38]